MDTGAEVGHQISERAGLPTFVKGFERLGDAVGGGRDLVGVDSVPFPAVFGTGKGRIPENQGLSTDQPFLPVVNLCQRPFKIGVYGRAWPEGCTTNYVHFRPILTRYTPLI